MKQNLQNPWNFICYIKKKNSIKDCNGMGKGSHGFHSIGKGYV